MTKQPEYMFNILLLLLSGVFKNTNVSYRAYEIDVSK